MWGIMETIIKLQTPSWNGFSASCQLGQPSPGTPEFNDAKKLSLKAYTQYLRMFHAYSYRHLELARKGASFKEIEACPEKKHFNQAYLELCDAYVVLRLYCDLEQMRALPLVPEKLQRKLISLLKPQAGIWDGSYRPEEDPFEFEMQALLEQGRFKILQLQQKPNKLNHYAMLVMKSLPWQLLLSSVLAIGLLYSPCTA